MNNKLKTFIISIALLGFISFSTNASEYSILPQPDKIEYVWGEYSFGFDLSVVYPIELVKESQLIKEWLTTDFVINPVLRQKKDEGHRGNINLVLDSNILPNQKEGYILDINNEGITIKANSKAGIIYGAQSLRQIIQERDGRFVVQNGTITDYPAFSWRAFMLDDARNFLGKEVVKNMLDEMVALKMNTFHWHLVDDQGWRIEIKKYPKLTEVGAFRDSTEINHFHSEIYDGKPHGGFYTQEEIKEIIKYASDRNIQIVPEIEMPGHASASIAAYPWLGVSGKKISVPCYYGVMYDVYDVSNPRVRTFLQDILEEVFALFPSPVIHIGGDEVRYNQWTESKRVSEYMKQNNLKTPAELQVHFTNQMSNWISGKGKKMMGWNEITGETVHDYQTGNEASIGNELSPETIVHFWKGDPSLINKTINKGYNIVNSYHVYTYLDYDYNSIPLSKSYSFNPIPEGIDKEKEKQVLGLGCQMWCEFIQDEKSMNKKVFPRIAAYAETGWTKNENKNYSRFKNSLEFFLNKWKKKGIEFGPTL